MKENIPFHKAARTFIKSLIAQRRYLQKLGFGKHPEIYKAISFLDRQLRAYSYSDDLLMSRFFVNHQDKILLIMPGEKSRCYKSNMFSFNTLLDFAREYSKNNVNHSNPLKTAAKCQPLPSA